MVISCLAIALFIVGGALAIRNFRAARGDRQRKGEGR